MVNTQPKILTEDQFSLVLSRSTIREYLRQLSDLDVDINATPAPSPKLIRARRQLRIFVADVEQEILARYRKPSTRNLFQSLNRDLVVDGVQLTGYREVTEEQAASVPGDPLYPDLPKLPDGTEYEAGDPNPITSNGDLVRAIRLTIADIADHEIERPDRFLESKSQAQSKEVYDLTERPRALYRRLRQFDARDPHHFL